MFAMQVMAPQILVAAALSPLAGIFDNPSRTICHESPKRSTHHPHRSSHPPSSSSTAHRRSVSAWSRGRTETDCADVSLRLGPPFGAIQAEPRA